VGFDVVGDAAFPPLPPTGPLVDFVAGIFVDLAAGPLVDFAAVANVPNSMPSIDIDPSSTLGSDIIERLWALSLASDASITV
jgi:hypothetical protein